VVNKLTDTQTRTHQRIEFTWNSYQLLVGTYEVLMSGGYKPRSVSSQSGSWWILGP